VPSLIPQHAQQQPQQPQQPQRLRIRLLPCPRVEASITVVDYQQRGAAGGPGARPGSGGPSPLHDFPVQQQAAYPLGAATAATAGMLGTAGGRSSGGQRRTRMTSFLYSGMGGTGGTDDSVINADSGDEALPRRARLAPTAPHCKIDDFIGVIR
jgi:hypothetical protein